MKRGQITGFYLETLLLILVFIAIILVLTQVFGLAGAESARAKELSAAVSLAANAAEAFSAAESPEALAALLNENGNAALMTDTAGVAARYGLDLRPDSAGRLTVEIFWLPEHLADGDLVRGTVLVRLDGGEEPIYRLETASFKGEAAA